MPLKSKGLPGFPDGVKSVLFVCTGNSCRSVIAEHLFRNMIRKKGHTLEVFSAGISALPGMGATDETIRTLKIEGLDAGGHRALRVTPELADRADVIFVMQEMHREAILQINPGVADKTYLLREFSADGSGATGIDVPDPIGRGDAVYEETKRLIQAALNSILAKME